MLDQRKVTLALTFLSGVLTIVGLILRSDKIIAACLFVAFIVLTPLPLVDFSRFEATDKGEFDKILKDPEGLRYFETHLINELSFENLFFYMEAYGFREAEAPQTPAQKAVLAKMARQIYNRYIPHNSILSINVSWRTTEPIEKAFAELEEGELVDQSVFDSAIQETYQLMLNYSFPRFKRTILYKMYIGIIKTDPNALTALEILESEDI